MNRCRMFLYAVIATVAIAGCTFNVDVGAGNLGPAVALPGVAMTDSAAGCVFWQAEDGREFTLYQDESLPNDLFDAVVTPGTPTRIVLSTNPDLGPECHAGATAAAVRRVLEIDGEDVDRETLLSKVLRDFEQRLDAASGNVQDRVNDLADQLRSNVEQFREQAGEAIENALAEIRGRIPAGDVDLAAAIEQAVAEIRERVSDRIEDALTNLELGGDGFLADVRDAAAQLRTELRAKVEELEQKLEERGDEFGDGLEAKRDELAARVDELRGVLQERFEARGQELRERLAQRVMDRLDDLKGRLQGVIDDLPARINPQNPGLGDELAGVVDGINTEIDDELDALVDRRDEIMADLEMELTLLTADLTDTATRALADIEADLLPVQ